MASSKITLSIFVFFRTIRGQPKFCSFSTLQTAKSKASGEPVGGSQFRRQVSLTSVLQRYGFPMSGLSQFIQSNPFLLDSDHLDVQRCMRVLLSFGLSQDALVSVVSSCPRVLEPGFLSKWQVAFSNLGFSSIPPLLVRRILEQSVRCQIEPEDVQRNLHVLRAVGFCDKTVIRILEELPAGRINLPVINCNLRFLRRIGLSDDEVDHIVYSFPGFLTMSSDGSLQPLFEEFGELSLADDEVRKAVLKNPRIILSMEVGELSMCIELLRSLKCRLPIKEKILREGPICSAIKVKLRVDCLCGYGLMRRDALKVLWKEPRSILYSIHDIEEKIEFLINTMGFGIEWLVEVPDYLGVNLEKQVVPRYNVIEYLRSKGALGCEVDLKHLIRPGRLKFYNMFVKPYPECEKLFGGLVRAIEVHKPRLHAEGLWTLFKPKKYPVCKEDICNMKLFMESLV